MAKSIHIFGGGTVMHVRNHLALCAPAYGTTARKLHSLLFGKLYDTAVYLHLTKMADHTSFMETNEDVAVRLGGVYTDHTAHAIVFNVALCDFAGHIGDVPSGKHAKRLKSREGVVQMTLTPAQKLLATVKAARPDIFLVGFKTTAGEDETSQRTAVERQIQETGVDLVIANDTVTRHNLLVAAEGYARAGSRESILAELAEVLGAIR
ncbi:hypothetical protein DIE18_04375 [Burkholderia sp. Bp9125]|nr:hypothetical protein DIE18_04375 [Burkholderia sp. Bp9125]